jgi:hypothetical protein
LDEFIPEADREVIDRFEVIRDDVVRRAEVVVGEVFLLLVVVPKVTSSLPTKGTELSRPTNACVFSEVDVSIVEPNSEPLEPPLLEPLFPKLLLLLFPVLPFLPLLPKFPLFPKFPLLPEFPLFPVFLSPPPILPIPLVPLPILPRLPIFCAETKTDNTKLKTQTISIRKNEHVIVIILSDLFESP